MLGAQQSSSTQSDPPAHLAEKNATVIILEESSIIFMRNFVTLCLRLIIKYLKDQRERKLIKLISDEHDA
jgi:hypothetical protein